MSIFAGLFKAPSRSAAKGDNLFSSSSKFKSSEADAVAPLAALNPQAKPPKERARDGATGKDVKRKRGGAAPVPEAEPSKSLVAKKSKSESNRVENEVKRKGEGKNKARQAAQAAEASRQLTTKKEEPAIDAEKVPKANNDTKKEEFGDDNQPPKKRAVSPESEKVSRTVFVGNIPAAVKRKSLALLFSQYGTVDSVRMRSVPLKLDAKMPRKAAIAAGNVDVERGTSHAYLVFKDESSAKAALAHNMKEFEGLHLRVDHAAVNKKAVKVAQAHAGSKMAAAAAAHGTPVQYDPARSVFIGNLHVQAEDEELIRFFIEGVGGASGQTDIEAVRIVRDPKTSVGKGIAFALFKTKAGRRAALSLDGRSLRKRPLRITVIKSVEALKGGAVGKASVEWLGAMATKSGRTRGLPGGGTLARAGGDGGVTGKMKTSGGGRGRVGKRPAVAARKQKQTSNAGTKRRKGTK